MQLIYKPDKAMYKIYDITYDNVGYPHFLIHRQGQWLRVSAKLFTPYYDDERWDIRDIKRIKKCNRVKEREHGQQKTDT